MQPKTHPRLILALLILCLLIVFGYSAYRLIDSMQPALPEGETEDGGKTVVRDGVEYFPRQDITTLLLMGIDQSGPVEDSGSYNNPGAADMLALVVFDEAAQQYNVLMINRDTIVEMPVLGVNAQPAGTVRQQIALAHTYGNGLEISCENTVNTVSDFLSGVTIDYYLSLNMDAISLLTDSLGGVRVHVTDDFSAVDPTITQGDITLSGAQALNFVRSRKEVGDQLNLSRLERQKDYITGFLSALGEKLEEDDGFVLSTYAELDPYSVSNVSVNTLSSMLSHYADYTLGELISPLGENQRPGEYMEFHVDEADLESIVFRLFYSEKK